MGGGGRSLTSADGKRTTRDGNVKGYRPRHSRRSVMVADGGLVVVVVVVVVVEVIGGCSGVRIFSWRSEVGELS